ASALANDPIAGPSAPSPSPSQSFLAQEDSAQAGTGVFTIPPDTTGAVGLDKIFVNLNNNYRVQNKTTGAALSTVAPDAFWAAVGADGVFDPRVVYDPYNHRWVLAAVSHSPDPNRQAQTFGQSSVLIGVSETADPEGDFLLTRFVVGCAPGAPGCDADGEWADFPMLGFNKNWVAVSWNQFTINGNFFVSGEALTLDYAALRAGTVTASRVRLAAGVEGSFCMHPATTLSPSEPTLYFVSHVNSEAAAYRVFNLTGTPAAPALTAGAVKVRDVHGQGAWAQPFGDLLPQKCAPGVSIPTQTCPASPRRIDVGDAYVRSNVVFRGGRLYYPQTVSLPAGLSPAFSRTGAQWTALDAATHEDVDGGRVYDLEATATNGGSWYAYPSLAVNRNGDILLGFSEFESDDYADAGYALRLATDAPGTMRDPVIYKEGEDYYEKTFGGSRNRWGDYSHAVVDPSNDRDLWTIQEYARPRVGLTGLDQNDSRWGTWWAKVSLPAAEGDLVISEFRLHGPGGANDEFVEIFNASGSDLRVATADGSAGYALVASDGGPRFTIPNGTVIPARGHFLGVNSTGYSLGSHPAGAGGATAAGDAAYAADIPANAGLALFRTADPAGFTLANRLDAVGSTAVADALYREGAGLAQIAPPAASNHSFYRSLCPGNTPNFGSSLGCVLGGAGLPRDTDANEHDFVFVDTAGANAGAGRRLGAPGPENLSSPVERNGGFVTFLLDATQGAAAPPNRLRVQSADPANNSALGTMELRRRVVNHTGQSVTRLRFRVADVTTFPAPSGFADLRARTAGAVVVSGVADTATCSPLAAPCSVTVRGTSLDTPPAQASGGGFNSALTVTLPAPLAPGASVNVRFLFGVQQTGNFRFYVNVEALP
ncbi:MAG TPA: lamin tail domain-containing protein, partial [Pyrinomonadaceae bacterium]|nr:lamin tail domain-containing protein [Pyrinomonadaceae bacterium]